MEHRIEVKENGLNVVIEVTKELDVRLLHFSALPFEPTSVDKQLRDPAFTPDVPRWFRLAEVHASGENQNDHHGSKHTATSPGSRLVYASHADTRSDGGRKLEIVMVDPITQLRVTAHLQFCDGLPVVTSWTEVTNEGTDAVGLEYVSSFALTGIAKEGTQGWEQKMKVHIPHHTWDGESQWRNYTLPELGLNPVFDFSVKRVAISSRGTWSSSEYLPMGCIENMETGSNLFWQIKHHGSWHWEISDIAGHLYLQLSGPSENEHQWWKNLDPGDTFQSVPVTVGSAIGGLQEAVGKLTQYRRHIRRVNEDNIQLPVIFNDYMNCLFGDPTTDKLIPLIDAAAEVGCEYFCIDCGWYSDGEWWEGVGEWLPSERRFPNGIKQVIDYIRDKGMIPGLWLEIEVMGIKCKLADSVPDNWFFLRHGKRVIDRGRYQLDFRNPDVRQHADRVVDRLVREYGVGYIKMDYNINAGVGTEVSSDSFGDGLLQHNRAYLAWLDRVFARYPELVIENCGSGGMRMDYALLQRHSIQSSSDQTDYVRNGVIAAASAAGVTPEQCAVWSYPLRDGDREEVVFNMVNAMLLRVHQSGHLAEIRADLRALVKEGLDYYKSIRMDIPAGLPIWPLGMPTFQDGWISYGMTRGEKTYVAVWRMDDSLDTCQIPLKHLKNKTPDVKCGYPSSADCSWSWDANDGLLNILLPKRHMARVFELQG